ncbi:MAG: hypothetical protein PHW92_02340 [Lutibacter sp.]|nr:hypothetical protein [Lutibacter sp.]
MNRKKVKLLIWCFGFMLSSLPAYAPPPPPGLPIDGGLSFLLASGVIYGIYSLKRKR